MQMDTPNLEKRFYALIIDFIIISFIITFISSFIEIDFYKIGSIKFLNQEWMVKYSIRFFVIVLYYIVFDCLGDGVSIGKRIMKLKIVNYHSQIPVFGQRLLRTILKSFLLFTFICPLLLIYYFIKKNIFYDIVLKTKVIMK